MKGHGDKNILKFCQFGPESPESKPSIHAAEVTSLRDWARTLFQTDTLSGIYPLATSSGARHSTNTKRWHAQELRHYMQMSTPLLTETPGTPQSMHSAFVGWFTQGSQLFPQEVKPEAPYNIIRETCTDPLWTLSGNFHQLNLLADKDPAGWLAVSTVASQQKGPGLNTWLWWVLSVCSLHVLPVLPWVASRCSTCMLG